MLVTDPGRSRLPLPDLVAEAVAGGVDGVYLRGVAVDASDADTGSERGMVQMVRASIGDPTTLLINSGPEAARRLGAGLHLREREPLPANTRKILGPTALIGRSIHSPEAAAAATGVDYLLAGHIYSSASKPGKTPLGLERLAAIVAAAPCPVLAIGGITAERVAEVVRAGAHGVAVIGAIAEAANPQVAAADIKAHLDRALSSRRTEEGVSMADTRHETEARSTIEIVVNGKNVAVTPGDTVHDFLASKRMTDQMAIVERNGEIVPRAEYGTTTLRAGDRLEVVHAVGGG